MSYDVHSGTDSGCASRRGGAGNGGESVLYYTVRPFRLAMAAQALPLLLLTPVMFFQPQAVVPVILTSLLTAWWTAASFRFELTAQTLRLKVGPFSATREIALRDVATAEALDPAGKPLVWGRHAASGHVRLKLRDGEDVVVVGLADPVETVDAVAALKRRLGA